MKLTTTRDIDGESPSSLTIATSTPGDESGAGGQHQQPDLGGTVWQAGQGTLAHVHRQRNRVFVEQMHPITDRRRFPPEDIKFGVERVDRHPARGDPRFLIHPRNPFPLTGIEEKLGDPIGGVGLVDYPTRRARRKPFNHRHRGGRSRRQLGKANLMPLAGPARRTALS